jgi:hypothetical protein
MTEEKNPGTCGRVTVGGRLVEQDIPSPPVAPVVELTDLDAAKLPAWFVRLVRAWNAMAQTAVPRFGLQNPVWAGNWKALVVERLGYPWHYQTVMKHELAAMGCVNQLNAPKSGSTTMELLKPPTLADYEQATGRKGRPELKAAQRGDDHRAKQRRWLAEQRQFHTESLRVWFYREREQGATDAGLEATLNLLRRQEPDEQRKLFRHGYPCMGFHGGAHVCGTAGLDANAWAAPPDAATVEALTTILETALPTTQRAPGRPRKYEGRSD